MPQDSLALVADEPGRFFVGQHFLYAMSSSTNHGVDRDADSVAKVIPVMHNRME